MQPSKGLAEENITMQPRKGFEITLKSGHRLFLLEPWSYDNRYQNPRINPIPQNTPLKIGNIGYCHRSEEIILFFETVDGGRLVRAAEFKVKYPFEDLERNLKLALLLSDQSLDIRYSSEMGNWRHVEYLRESVIFFNKNDRLHQIDSDSHCLIKFPNGLELSQSALRSTYVEYEKELSFIIQKLQLEKKCASYEALTARVSAFLQKHNITVYRQPTNQPFFPNSASGPTPNPTSASPSQLISAVNSNNSAEVQRCLNEGISPDTKDKMTSYNLYDIAVERDFKEVAQMLRQAGAQHSAYARDRNAALTDEVRTKNWKMVKFSLTTMRYFVNIPLFLNESKTLLDLLDEDENTPPEIYDFLEKKGARRSIAERNFSDTQVNKPQEPLNTLDVNPLLTDTFANINQNVEKKSDEVSPKQFLESLKLVISFSQNPDFYKQLQQLQNSENENGESKVANNISIQKNSPYNGLTTFSNPNNNTKKTTNEESKENTQNTHENTQEDSNNQQFTIS